MKNNVTLQDYIRQDKGYGVITYAITPEACERLGKKRMAGKPKSIIIHMPTSEEGIKKLDDTYIEYAEKAAAKSLGVN